MKGNVVFGSRLKDLSQQIGKLTKNLNDVMATNEKIASELSVVKKINSNLENRITALEKLQAKAEQYNRRINVKISSISNDVSDNGVEEKVIGICKDSNIVITSNDIEGCHRFPLVRNSTNKNKRLIVKFVNRNHSEVMLRLKKNVSFKSKVYNNNSLCPCYRFL